MLESHKTACLSTMEQKQKQHSLYSKIAFYAICIIRKE